MKGNLYKNTYGVYYYRVMEQGKIISKSLGTKDLKTAELLVGEIKRKKALNKLGLNKDGNILLPDVVKDVGRVKIENMIVKWIEYGRKSGNAIKTLAIKRNAALEILRVCTYVDELNNKDNLESIRDIFFNEYGRTNRTTLGKFINNFINYMIGEELDLAKCKNHIRVKKYFTFDVIPVKEIVYDYIDEVHIILEYIKQNYPIDVWFYVATLYYTCSRPSEIINLERTDFNIRKNSVTIYQNKIRKAKKIPILPHYVDDVIYYLKNLEGNKVFPYSNIKYYSRVYNLEIKKILKLDKDSNLYTWRHSGATALYKQTKDIKLVCLFTGDRVETVMKHYVNINIDSAQNDVKMVDMAPNYGKEYKYDLPINDEDKKKLEAEHINKALEDMKTELNKRIKATKLYNKEKKGKKAGMSNLDIELQEFIKLEREIKDKYSL